MSIDNFRQNFKGVRSNRFEINGTYVTSSNGNSESPTVPGGNAFKIYAKAASVPGSSIGIIPVGYKGRPVKFSGERTYTDWAVQVYDSNIVDIRQRFEDWIELMDNRREHEINYNLTSDWEVLYQDIAGTQSNSNYNKRIKLVHCFPVDISPIELSYDVPDTFAEFTLTLTYDYWEYV